jgi:protein-S-isoprenylcysteine O-methyltransferase Ste14
VATAASTPILSMLLTASGLAVFVLFAWAVRGHFVSAGLPTGMKLISALSLLGVAGYLLEIGNRGVPDWRRAAAFGLQALAGGLFLWACAATRRERPALAFSRSEPGRVFKTGPYRYVRHPFYSSYIIFWAACAIATPSMLVIATTIVLVAIYSLAALQEQHAILSSDLRPEYEAYQRTTGLIWPKLPFGFRKTR